MGEAFVKGVVNLYFMLFYPRSRCRTARTFLVVSTPFPALQVYYIMGRSGSQDKSYVKTDNLGFQEFLSEILEGPSTPEGYPPTPLYRGLPGAPLTTNEGNYYGQPKVGKVGLAAWAAQVGSYDGPHQWAPEGTSHLLDVVVLDVVC